VNYYSQPGVTPLSVTLYLYRVRDGPDNGLGDFLRKREMTLLLGDPARGQYFTEFDTGRLLPAIKGCLAYAFEFRMPNGQPTIFYPDTGMYGVYFNGIIPPGVDTQGIFVCYDNYFPELGVVTNLTKPAPQPLPLEVCTKRAYW